MKKIFKTILGKDTAGATVFAIIALIISVRGCVIAQKSLDISKKNILLNEQNFNAERLLLLSGTFDMKQETLQLRPVGNNCQLQKIVVFYPKEISDTEWSVDGPDFKLHFTHPLYILSQKITKKYPYNPKIFKYIKGTIPITISSFYVAKGRIYSDKSLYGITYQGCVSTKKYQPAELDFSNLVFLGRLPMATDDQNFLNQIYLEWQKKDH